GGVEGRTGKGAEGTEGRRDGAAEGKGNAGPSATPPLRPSAWENPVLLTTAAKGEGIPELVAALDHHHAYLTDSGELERRRRRRLSDRTREVVDRATQRWIWEETRAEQLIGERLDQVVAGSMSPYDVAAEVLDGLKQGARI
ncbi:MAG: hypothetical protein M3Q37_06390, partial [Gemmatimonadota bacterium]|nr:hypothetical protein [Gemmatimonadota bacterium]